MPHSHSSTSLEEGDTDIVVSRRQGSEAFPLGNAAERLATLPGKTEPSPALIAQTNWNFVEKLLKVRD